VTQADVAAASLGILATRAKTIVVLAQAIAKQTLSFTSRYPVEQMIAQLQGLPGIGPCTAHYIAMRVLNAPDIFLPNDLGIRKALGENNLNRMLVIAAPWQPWCSYATLHLWKLLERTEVFESALVAPQSVA
jgi:AraC family transcriptional regulator, regulatory protein of adaptative response / DNA-3-methyladenine glycosylase II